MYSQFFCLLDSGGKSTHLGDRSVKVAQFDLQSPKMMEALMGPKSILSEI